MFERSKQRASAGLQEANPTIRHATAHNSDCPPSHDAQFRLPHWDLYIAHPGSNTAVYGWTLEMARENWHDSCYLARPSHRVVKEILAYRPMCSVVTTPRTAD